MIVVSMLLVIVGAVTLVIGVFFGSDDNLTLVYVSIGACLLAFLFLVAGILRNRPSRKPVLSSDGGDATWSGATAWPGAGGPEAAASPVRASTGVLERDAEPAQPEVQIVTARPEAEQPAARRAEPTAAELADDEDVVVVPKRAAERIADRAPAKKTTAKKAPAKKAPAKKAPAKKTPAKKTAGKKTAAKKAAPAKKAAAKKTTAKETTPAKKTAAKKVTRKKS